MIKFYGDIFGIYAIFGKKNQRKAVPEGGTSQQGMAQGERPDGLCLPLKLVGALLPWQEIKIHDKIPSKSQPDRSYGSPDI